MLNALLSTRQGEYCILEAALPERPPEPAGVVLYDPGTDQLDFRLRRDWHEFADEEDAEVLGLLDTDLRLKLSEMGPAGFLAYLEDTLSNTLRLSERESVLLGNFDATLNRLYQKAVPSTILRFETHLPVYTLQAAAGSFGEQMPEEDPDEWLEAPEDLKLTPAMFVATVVGRSMEPKIPDGSRCIFRKGVAGTRQGKWLLVVNRAESEAGGLRYTVKQYRSEKVATEEGWRHERVFMIPANPEFETWEISDDMDCDVIAEFVRVLD